MKKNIIFLIAISLLSIWGCSDSSDVQRLMSAYTMMDNKDSLDEADMIITLYSDTKMSDECQAIYNLCKARLDYLQDKEVSNDSLLNISIDYFKKKDNKRLLAESYYYKGATMPSDKSKEAIVYLKEAEICAKEVNDPKLNDKIFSDICYFCLFAGEHNIAKEYAFKTLNLAKKEKNNGHYCTAAYLVGTYYYNVGKNDSMFYYFDSMKPYLKTLDDNEKCQMLSNMGAFLSQSYPEQAEKYLKESIAIKPISTAYTGLSIIYTYAKDYEKASEYLKEAYKYSENIADSFTNAQILLKQKIDSEEYEEACEIYGEIWNLQKRLSDVRRSDNLVKVQAQYNVLAKEREYQSTIQKISIIVVSVVIIIIFFLFYNHIRMMKMKERQLRDQLLLQVYNGKIKDLETSESASSAQVQNLKDKVTQLQQKQGERLSAGKQLYEHIMNGGNIVQWAKQDYSNFFDYYNLIDMPFMLHMEKDYDNLSSRSMIYLILCNMGKTEEDIEKIFGVSNSAIRSIKSRTKSRLINKES